MKFSISHKSSSLMFLFTKNAFIQETAPACFHAGAVLFHSFPKSFFSLSENDFFLS